MLGKTSNPNQASSECFVVSQVGCRGDVLLVLRPRFSFAILVAIICHLRLSPYGPSPGTSEPSELSFGMWCGPLSLRSFSWFPSWKLKMHRVCSRCLSCQWRQDECLLEIRQEVGDGQELCLQCASFRSEGASHNRRWHLGCRNCWRFFMARSSLRGLGIARHAGHSGSPWPPCQAMTRHGVCGEKPKHTGQFDLRRLASSWS